MGNKISKTVIIVGALLLFTVIGGATAGVMYILQQNKHTASEQSEVAKPTKQDVEALMSDAEQKAKGSNAQQAADAYKKAAETAQQIGDTETAKSANLNAMNYQAAADAEKKASSTENPSRPPLAELE